MRVGMIGTGVVGRTLGSKLVELGHEVMMGSRQRGNEHAVEWCQSAGERASEGTFADAAAFGEVVVNATAGAVSLQALRSAGASNFSGKVLIDVANPIAPDTGFPPELSVCNNDSLGEQIQREFPDARVVKTFNTVNSDVMVNPPIAGRDHVVFVGGEDLAAKQLVSELLRSFGWDAGAIVDLGGIETSRGMEMYLELWLRLMIKLGTGHFNISITHAI